MKLKEGWEKHLERGAGSEEQGARSTAPISKLPAPSSLPLELVFLPDPTIYDGAWANNGWLQELPKPLTKLTWGNAALMSPATARQIGVEQGSYAHGGEHGGYYMPVVELKCGGQSLSAPVWIMPGHADGTVSVYLGNGRERAGRVGGSREQQVGFNAYRLRTAESPWFAAGLTVSKTSGTELVACTQEHQTMDNRARSRAATLAEYRANPQFASEPEREEAPPRRPIERRCRHALPEVRLRASQA